MFENSISNFCFACVDFMHEQRKLEHPSRNHLAMLSYHSHRQSCFANDLSWSNYGEVMIRILPVALPIVLHKNGRNGCFRKGIPNIYVSREPTCTFRTTYMALSLSLSLKLRSVMIVLLWNNIASLAFIFTVINPSSSF